MSKIREMFEKMKSGWNKLDKNKKIFLVVMLVGVIVFISIYTYTTKKSNYAVLFSDLSLEDAGRIVNDLEAKEIKYKLEEDGTKILIDEKEVDKYRLDLATEGNLPENFLGMEIFDDMGMMVTDEDRKIMYQRALEGELQRSIMSLSSVKAAKVHLVMAEKSIFETEEREASASVVVDIEPGQQLSDNSVVGIKALVAGAVENLPEHNIQIIDSKGNVLTGGSLNGELNGSNLANTQNEIKRDFEKELEHSLISLLSDVLGRGKVRVVVNADLDFDAEEQTTVRYFDPVKRSEQFNASGDRIETNQQQDEEGLIGANPSNVIGEVTGDGSNYEGIINNELSSETTTTIKAPGKINRLSASVVYDGSLSQDQARQIEDIVATAIGYDFDRDDLISVVGMKFDKSDLEEAQLELEKIKEEEESKAQIEKYKTAGMYAFGSAIIVALVVTMIRAIKQSDTKDTNYQTQEISVEEAFKSYEEAEAEKEKLDKEKEEEIEISVDEKERKAKLYAEEHPDLAADLIKTWLKEDED